MTHDARDARSYEFRRNFPAALLGNASRASCVTRSKGRPFSPCHVKRVTRFSIDGHRRLSSDAPPLRTPIGFFTEYRERISEPRVRAAQFRRSIKRGKLLDRNRRTDPCRASAPRVDASRVSHGGEPSQERCRLLGTSSLHPNRALPRAPRLPAHSQGTSRGRC